jgi:hypothetical protein
MRLRLLSLSLSLLFVACVPAGTGYGPGKGDGGGSILASLDGIDAKDRARSGIQYLLLCDNKAPIKAKEVSTTAVTFDGTSLVDGQDQCALEVRADVVAGEKITWYSRPETPGLYYGSDKKLLQARRLKLKLYKLYSIEQEGGADTFSLRLALKFTPTGPAATGVAAAMTCGDKTYPGSYIAQAATTGEALFEALKLSELKAKTCTKLTILVDNQAAFEGSLLDLNLGDARASTELKYPAEEGQRITLTPKSVGGDDVGVDTDPAHCINYDVAARACLDVKAYDVKGYIFAMVKGRDNNGDGAIVEHLLTATAGVGKLASGKLDLELVNIGLKEGKYSLWKKDAKATILAKGLAADLVDGTALASVKADATAVKVLHIETVWQHAFGEIAEADLDGKTTANWFAHVTVTKGDQTAKFVVGGPEKTMLSTSRAATDHHFSWDAMIADLKTGAGTKWALYTYSGGAMPKTGCTIDQTYFATDLSQLSAAELAAGDATLEACRHSRTTIDKSIDETWTPAMKYYVLGWRKL